MATSSKKSPVWTYFTQDEKSAKCNLCQVNVSHGGIGRKAGTSSLKKHLQFKHKVEYEQLYGSISNSPSQCESGSDLNILQNSQMRCDTKQPSLEEVLDKKKLWDINDSRAKRYHYFIGEMIADNEPVTMVESHLGFRRLINNILPQYQIPFRNYFNEKIIPEIYENVTKVKSSLQTAEHIAFTTDLWTSSVNNLAFISCTGHWLSQDFTLNHVVLNIKHFPESHTAQNIMMALHECTTDWVIAATKVCAVVHDNAANMTKGVTDTGFPSVQCFIYTLQLVITDSMKAQPSVVETLIAARRIVTHFNHSGYTKLHEIQAELNLPLHKLHQDVQTRWNSTYCLLERLIEQRRAISVYISESRSKSLNFDNLSSEQWDIAQQLIMLLKPFEEVTKITSSTYSSISDVIPHVTTLSRYLQKEEFKQHTPQVEELRQSLQNNLNVRFDPVLMHENHSYLLSTLLDPRYKALFYNSYETENARRAILREALQISMDDEESNNETGPAGKRSRLDAETHNLFWACFEETAKESETNQNSSKNSAAAELDHCLNSARACRDINPYKWWADNMGHYPIIKSLATRYLTTPASSVYSECLFSEAGNIYENKRNRLNPDRAEQLVFLHHNLPLLNYEY